MIRTAYTSAAGVVGAAAEPAVRRATALVTVVMSVVAVSEAGLGSADGGLGRGADDCGAACLAVAVRGPED
jgi:hypothetical protein